MNLPTEKWNANLHRSDRPIWSRDRQSLSPQINSNEFSTFRKYEMTLSSITMYSHPWDYRIDYLLALVNIWPYMRAIARLVRALAYVILIQWHNHWLSVSSISCTIFLYSQTPIERTLLLRIISKDRVVSRLNRQNSMVPILHTL